MNEEIGRNDPCPCGSGKKYKKCHGRTDELPGEEGGVAVRPGGSGPGGVGAEGVMRIRMLPDEGRGDGSADPDERQI